MKRAVLILALTVCAAAIARAEDARTVEAAELGRAVAVRGQLGWPLGQVITIEGRDLERDVKRPKASSAEHLFRVTKVEGQTLPEPQLIILRFFRFRSVPSPGEDGKRVLRGYEDGGFTGIPAAALKEMGTVPQTTDWHFRTHFQVIK